MGVVEALNTLERIWWRAPRGDVSSRLFSLSKFIEDKQRYWSTNNLINFKLYGNANVLGLNPFGYARRDNGPENTITLNMCQNMVDTMTSEIGTQTPKATFLTSGGDYSLQQRAKKLDKFVSGVGYHTQFNELRQQMFMDACVFGTGVVKIFPQSGNVCAERLLIDEIKVTDIDGMYGKPRSIFHERYMPREIVAALYPKAKTAINMANGPTFDSAFVPLSAGYYETYDQIKVIEAFHLPSTPTSTDGRHVICIEGADLVDEKWTLPRFPYVFFRWCPRLLGFYGQGIVEQVRDFQLELNKLMRTWQTSIHLLAIPYVLIEMGSKISSSLINNEVGRIMKFSGTAPQVVAPQAVPPDLFQAVNWLYEKAFEKIGISQMASQALKPPGLDAAVAIREFHDIQSRRFQAVGKRWEQVPIHAAQLFIDAAKQIAESEDGFQICCVNKRFIETIKWKEVEMDESDYVMQVFPTSSLRQDPAGRLQDIMELMQGGLISPETGRRLLDFPDLEAEMSIENAGQDDIDQLIEHMMDSDFYVAPEVFQNLVYGISRMGKAYLRGKLSQVPEIRLANMRLWISEASALLSSGQPQSPAQIQGAPNQPLAAPMPQPVSQMVPNVPIGP